MLEKDLFQALKNLGIEQSGDSEFDIKRMFRLLICKNPMAGEMR